MSKHRPLLAVGICLLLIVFAAPAAAQTLSCPELVQRALNEVGSTCASQSRNSACYGFNQVTARFNQPVDSTFFTQPADRAGLSLVERLQTAALNEAEGTWGIVTMAVQANLPAALPGENAIFILLGDVEIENDVAPENSIDLPEEGLPVTVTAQADLLRNPAADSEVLGSIDAGATLQADAFSEDETWLRVFFMSEGSASAWIPFDAVQVDESLNTLPHIGEASQTPMQAFRFRTGISGLSCEEAPSALLVQGPENIQIDITANGADVRIGSLVMFQTDEDGNMIISVLSGAATLNPDTPEAIILLAGFSSICSQDTIQNGTCTWSEPEPYSTAIQQIVAALDALFENADNLFNYKPSPPQVSCASGEGEAVCEFTFDNPTVDLALAQQICSRPGAPAACQQLFPEN